MILRDCKNAVNCRNKNYTTPCKYAEECQNIYTEMNKHKNENKEIEIKWIPGHTENL